MVSRLTPMKLITFGGTMAMIAAAVGVYILAADQKGGFFQLDGWIVTVVFAIGTVIAFLYVWFRIVRPRQRRRAA